MDLITHNALRHLKALRQTLSQSNKPIGFLISAGCPLAVAMPDKKWPLIPDMKGLSKHVERSFKSTDSEAKYARLIDELEKSKRDKNNLEEILSFIRSLKEVAQGGNVRGFNEEELIELESSICDSIVEKIKVELPDKNTPYHKLTRWISSIDRDKAIEIFTTNYDLLMEQALEEVGAPFYDGFVGAKQPFFDLRTVEENLSPTHWTKLWKIHGSINWFLNDKKDVFRASGPHPIQGHSHLIYPSHLKYEQSRKMPFLALSDQLSRFLKQQSAALVLCGYSFNDEHINDTIINALKSNPTAIVIALMFGKMANITDESKPDEKIENYPKGIEKALNTHNLSIWTDDEAIIGTNRGFWSSSISEKEESLKEFIIEKKGESGNTSIIEVKMGDFKTLGDFLSFLIGNNADLDDK